MRPDRRWGPAGGESAIAAAAGGGVDGSQAVCDSEQRMACHTSAFPVTRVLGREKIPDFGASGRTNRVRVRWELGAVSGPWGEVAVPREEFSCRHRRGGLLRLGRNWTTYHPV